MNRTLSVNRSSPLRVPNKSKPSTISELGTFTVCCPHWPTPAFHASTFLALPLQILHPLQFFLLFSLSSTPNFLHSSTPAFWALAFLALFLQTWLLYTKSSSAKRMCGFPLRSLLGPGADWNRGRNTVTLKDLGVLQRYWQCLRCMVWVLH